MRRRPEPVFYGQWLSKKNIMITMLFFVYDEQQNRRIDLGLGKDGAGAALHLYNSRGEKTLQLMVTDDRAALNISGEVVLGAGEGIPAGAGLSLSDKEGNTRLGIVMVKSEPPIIFIQDENGELVWSAP